MELESTILNLTQNRSRWNGTIRHFQEGELENFAVSWKNNCHRLLDDRSVVLVNFLARGARETFDSCIETPESPNVLSRVLPTRELSDTSPIHDKVLTPHTDASTCFECRVLGHPFYNPDLSPPDCHLSGPFENSLQRHHYANYKARDTAESCGPVLAEEEEHLLSLDKKSSCSKFEEDCRRSWSLH